MLRRMAIMRRNLFSSASSRLVVVPLGNRVSRVRRFSFPRRSGGTRYGRRGKEMKVPSSEYVAKPGQRDSRDSVVERVGLFDRCHDIRCVWANRVKRAVGAPSDGGRRRRLALERHRPCFSFDNKIHFGSGGIFQYIYVVFRALSCLQPCKFNSHCGNCKDKNRFFIDMDQWKVRYLQCSSRNFGTIRVRRFSFPRQSGGIWSSRRGKEGDA